MSAQWDLILLMNSSYNIYNKYNSKNDDHNRSIGHSKWLRVAKHYQGSGDWHDLVRMNAGTEGWHERCQAGPVRS